MKVPVSNVRSFSPDDELVRRMKQFLKDMGCWIPDDSVLLYHARMAGQDRQLEISMMNLVRIGLWVAPMNGIGEVVAISKPRQELIRKFVHDCRDLITALMMEKA